MFDGPVLKLARVVAALIGLSFFMHGEMVRIAIGPVLGVQSTALALVIAWVWILLNVATVAGLALGRRWSAQALLALVPFSTLFLSLSLIPGVTSVVPQDYRFPLMALSNIFLLPVVPILLKGSRKTHPQPASAPEVPDGKIPT